MASYKVDKGDHWIINTPGKNPIKIPKSGMTTEQIKKLGAIPVQIEISRLRGPYEEVMDFRGGPGYAPELPAAPPWQERAEQPLQFDINYPPPTPGPSPEQEPVPPWIMDLMRDARYTGELIEKRGGRYALPPAGVPVPESRNYIPLQALPEKFRSQMLSAAEQLGWDESMGAIFWKRDDTSEQSLKLLESEFKKQQESTKKRAAQEITPAQERKYERAAQPSSQVEEKRKQMEEQKRRLKEERDRKYWRERARKRAEPKEKQ